MKHLIRDQLLKKYGGEYRAIDIDTGMKEFETLLQKRNKKTITPKKPKKR